MSWKILLGSVFLVAIAVFAVFGLYEIRFALYGTTVEGQVQSVRPFESGFNHSQSDGTTPRIAYDVAFEFTYDGKSFVGQQRIFDETVRKGDKVLVQFIRQTPAIHRLLTPQFRIRWFWGAFVLGVGVIVLSVFCIVRYKRISGWNIRSPMDEVDKPMDRSERPERDQRAGE